MTTLSGPGTRLREARVEALLRLIPLTQVFTVVDVVLLSTYFWSELGATFLLWWSSLAVANTVFWWWYARRALKVRHPARPGRMHAMLIHSVTEGLVFSSFLIVAFPVVPAGKAVVLAAFAMGLLAAGGFSKMMLPLAAVVFLTLLGLGTELALFRSLVPSPAIPAALLAAFTVAIGALVYRISRIFGAWVAAQEDLDRQNTLISHLLTDFEESASEALWESDTEGRVTFVSPRFSQILEIPDEDLRGRMLVPWAEWGSTLEKGAAFRNLVVPVDLGKPRWWSLSGKPIRDSEGRITGWRGVGSDITGARLQELEMVRLSRYDALTGLLNRHSFRTLIEEPFQTGRPAHPLCLVLVDLVDFQDVNESRGHQFGDALLVAVAHRLGAVATGAIQLARLDGDEFALWGPLSLTIKETRKSLQTLVTRLSEPFLVEGTRYEAQFQIGVAFCPQDAQTPEQWLRCANLALRWAKDQGTEPLVFFTTDMLESYKTRSALREDLAGALGRGELWLAFQPLVNLKSGAVTGFEALVRWNHPVRGAVPPSVFIPLAEETGLILSLGLWVLEQACVAARNWPSDLSVSVNVSGVQLRLPSLANDIASVLLGIGFDPHRLILEVTESALVKDDPSVGQTLSGLKRMGILLALDDFGTGFSALSYLQNFPFDKLKIDQSFVRPISGSSGPSLLASIIGLARALGLDTTAEGIEDETHLSVLKELGCAEGQGYLFSRPIPASEVTNFLSGRPLPVS